MRSFSMSMKGQIPELPFDSFEENESKSVSSEDHNQYSSFVGRVEKIIYTDNESCTIFTVSPIRGKPIYSFLNGQKKVEIAPKIIYLKSEDHGEIIEKAKLSFTGHWEDGERGVQFNANSCTSIAVETDEEITTLLTSGKWSIGQTKLDSEIGTMIVRAAKQKGQPLKLFLNSPVDLGRIKAINEIGKMPAEEGGVPYFNRLIARSWYYYNQSYLFAEALSKFELNRGMGRKIFDYIARNYARIENSSNLFTGLSEHFKRIKTIKNKDWSVEIDRELYLIVLDYFSRNPYRFSSVKGCGFLSLDKTALNLGFNKDSPIRLSALIEYAVHEQCVKNSSTVQERDAIYRTASKVHNLTPERFREVFQKDLNERKIIGRRLDLGQGVKEYFTTAHIFQQEYKVAEAIVNLTNGQIELNQDAISEIIAEKFPVQGPQFCDTQQKEAILNAYKSPISIITGGPGCGKTFSIRNLIYILDKYECSIGDVSFDEAETVAADDLIGDVDFFDEIFSEIDGKDLFVEDEEIETEAENTEDFFEETEQLAEVKTGTKPKRIVLLAPTGRAAKRMEEMIQMDPRFAGKRIQAKTIHRLIYPVLMGNSDGGEWRSDSTFIIDESSMIDTVLMSQFISLLKENNRLVLVGDVDQLPPVGLGQIMKDLLSFPKVSACRLNTVHRVSDESTIPLLVKGIKEKRTPPLTSKYLEEDFSFLTTNDDEESLSLIKQVIKSLLESGYEKSDIQLISPQQSGLVGWKTLNVQLRHLLNESGKNLTEAETIGRKEFLDGDRVINTKNNYDLDIFNGDVGIAKNIQRDGAGIRFDFNLNGKRIDIDKTVSPSFLLSYAYTVHKSQGSESPVIIFPISKSHSYSLNNNMLYTGVSRAKEKVILIGNLQTFFAGIGKKEDEKRLSTLLCELTDFDAKREGRLNLFKEINTKQLPIEIDDDKWGQ